jgi:hypothetical protein
MLSHCYAPRWCINMECVQFGCGILPCIGANYASSADLKPVLIGWHALC